MSLLIRSLWNTVRDCRPSVVTAGPRYRGWKYNVCVNVERSNVLCVADVMVDFIAYGRLLKWN